MKLLAVPAITYKQSEILDLLYSHRFLTRIQIQAFLKHKDKKTINLWLRDLRSKGYIKWIYNKEHFAQKTRPAIYYLGINGIRHFQNRDFHDSQEIGKRYREPQRSQTFIEHCLMIADTCLGLEAARDENSYPQTWYFYETQADYLSESYYYFLSDSEYIRPDLGFCKLEYDGLAEPHAVECYLLEIFDPTLPRYRLRYRLKKYVEYLEGEMDEWEDETYGEPLPIVLLVCSSLPDSLYAKRRTRGLLADIWERDDQDRPRIRFTTMAELKEHGVLGDIWEEA